MGYSHHTLKRDVESFNEAAAEGGLILDLSEFSKRKTPKTGYVFNSDYRLNSPFARAKERQEVETLRNAVSQPHILGTFSAPQGIIVPKQDGMRIKPSGDMNVYLPDYYDFVLPIVVLALKDTLSLYGSKKFEESSALLVVKKSDVENNTAQREEFSDWHDHYNSTRYKTDLIYTFHTTLPTQFKREGKILVPPENAILRFGGEELHRSQKNQRKRTERLWGAVIIEEKEMHRNGSPDNEGYVGIDDSLFKQFMRAATNSLLGNSSVKVLSSPVALMNFEDALQLET